MTQFLRFSVLTLALLAGPAAAEQAPLFDATGECPLTGPVDAPSASCVALRATYHDALSACLQDRRLKAASSARLGVRHGISAPAARAGMLICKEEVRYLTLVVE